MSEDNRPFAQSIKAANTKSRIVARTVTPEQNKGDGNRAKHRDDIQKRLIYKQELPKDNTRQYPGKEEEEDIDIMVTSVELEKLNDAIESIKPNLDPSVLDVQNSRKRTANVLAQKLSIYQDAGYAWLVDDKEAYKRRVGWTPQKDDQGREIPFKMPTRATRPEEPATITSNTKWDYERKLSRFLAEEHYDKEALKMIKKEFPTGLVDKEIDFNMLDTKWTARKAYDHIEAKMRSEEVAQDDYINLWKAVLELEYRPDPQGPEQFFKQQKEHQRRILLVNEGPGIKDGTLIAAAKRAFTKSGHNQLSLDLILAKWKNKDEECLKTHTEAHHKKTKYGRFQLHYLRELKKLYRSDHGRPTQKAMHTEELSTDIQSMKEDLEQVKANQDQLYDNQKEIAAYASDATTTPSTLTPNSNTAAIKEMATAMAKTMAEQMVQSRSQDIAAVAAKEALKALQLTNNPGCAKISEKEMGWRQWKYWCYTCGVNLYHNTKDHPDSKRKMDGHDTHTNTTKDAPQGGNTKRNHLWLKWCEPVTFNVCEAPK